MGTPQMWDRGSVGILALAPNVWDGPWMNRQQLLSRLGPDYDVIYTTGPISKYPRGARHPQLWPRVEARENVRVDLLPTWMKRAARRHLPGRFVTHALVKRWRSLLGHRPSICWCFHPSYWPLVAALEPRFVVYHVFDLYRLQGRWTPTLEKYETNLASRADLTVASSGVIADHLRRVGARAPLLVENAADYASFALDPSEDPPDLAPIPRPRIGYIGALNRKVDFQALLRVASHRPDWQVVLIGAIGNLDAVSQHAVTHLQSLPNVHFLGFKDRAQLAGYAARMDVNLLAYRVSGDLWTEGIYPLKLHEYLAAGQPVVSTDLPSIRQFADVVRIVEDSRWEEAIESVLVCPGDKARRRAVASVNSWESRVAILETHLREMLSHAHN